ncbi:MAG TPA: hypothetical protein VGN81_07410 [Pseudonocardiaceae bacterium]
MSSQDDVHRIATALPCVTEHEHAYKVKGKLFAWNWPEKLDPKKARLPNPDVLATFAWPKSPRTNSPS